MALNHFASRIFSGLKHFYSNHFGAARISDVKGPLNLWDSFTKVNSLVNKISSSYELQEKNTKLFSITIKESNIYKLSSYVEIVYLITDSKIDEHYTSS